MPKADFGMRRNLPHAFGDRESGQRRRNGRRRPVRRDPVWCPPSLLVFAYTGKVNVRHGTSEWTPAGAARERRAGTGRVMTARAEPQSTNQMQPNRLLESLTRVRIHSEDPDVPVRTLHTRLFNGKSAAPQQHRPHFAGSRGVPASPRSWHTGLRGSRLQGNAAQGRNSPFCDLGIPVI